MCWCNEAINTLNCGGPKCYPKINWDAVWAQVCAEWLGKRIDGDYRIQFQNRVAEIVNKQLSGE